MTRVELSDTPGRIDRAPPLLGEHTGEVLRAAGYTDDEIPVFRSDGVV